MQFRQKTHIVLSMEKTIRQELIKLLQVEAMTVRELSQTLSLMEKEILMHLEHVDKTARSQGLKLHITPCKCQDCNYVFADRTRLTKPGRCPRCKESHILPPRFSIR